MLFPCVDDGVLRPQGVADAVVPLSTHGVRRPGVGATGRVIGSAAAQRTGGILRDLVQLADVHGIGGHGAGRHVGDLPFRASAAHGYFRPRRACVARQAHGPRSW